MLIPIILLIFSHYLTAGSPRNNIPYEIVFSWNQVDFQFPSSQTRQQYIASGQFIPQNCPVVGIKVWSNRIFLTVPRWLEGVPSTLNYVDKSSPSPSPILKPYPSWKLQQVGNCSAIQSTPSLEIDQFGRMWVIDTGRINTFAGESLNLCPPKLLLIDLVSDRVVHTFEFPPIVLSPETNGLNDIVVGCQSRSKCWAYLTDASDAKLVVYSLEEDRSWYVTHNSSMQPEPGAEVITNLGQEYTVRSAINGIALSPKASNFDRIYYKPVSAFHLYSVPAEVVQKSQNGAILDNRHVTLEGSTGSQTSGLMMDSKSRLYYGLLARNSIVSRRIEETGDISREAVLIHNDTDLQWMDSYSIDTEGYLYLTSNRLHKLLQGQLDPNEVNYRVIKMFIGGSSYMY